MRERETILCILNENISKDLKMDVITAIEVFANNTL